MKTIVPATAAAMMLALAGCKQQAQVPTEPKGGAAATASGQGPGPAATVGTTAATQGFPTGFSAMPGARSLVSTATPKYPGGRIVTYAIDAKPAEVGAYYEAIVKRQGMTTRGTARSDDSYSLAAFKQGGDPKSVSVTAIDKGAFTNVSMMFNVTN